MNNRFKFRVWDSECENMFYPKDNKDYIEIDCDGELIGYDTFGSWVGGNNCIPMQCTGLKDKNGTLIYEGDIIRCMQKRPQGYETKELRVIGVVSWSEPLLVYEVVEANEATSLAFFDNYEIEVIGNIYENPELLKGQND